MLKLLVAPAQERLQQKLEKQEMLQAAKRAKKERGKKVVYGSMGDNRYRYSYYFDLE